KGIGPATAKKIIEAAKTYKNTLTLSKYANSKIIKKSPKKDIGTVKIETKKEINGVKKNFKWFDNKLKRPTSNVWYPPKGPAISEDTESLPIVKSSSFKVNNSEVEDPYEFEELLIESNTQVHPTIEQPSPPAIIASTSEPIPEKIHNTFFSEKLVPLELEHIKSEILEVLTSNKYSIIHPNPLLNTIFRSFDLFGVKIVKVNELLDMLLIVPIKINSFKGSIVVSEDSVQYNGERYNRELNTVLKANLDKLVASQESIFQQLISEGPLFRFFRNYLKLNFSIEKTITNKRIFFRAGPLQIKVLIEPIFINQGSVGLIEKLIPFAYQKHSNVYIIESTKLSELLSYLEKKYYLIETQCEQESSITRYFKATESFMEEVRLYSFPFIGFGVIFVIALFSQIHELIQVFVNLGIALIFIYAIVFGYLYFKFYRNKVALQQEFHTPYYQRQLGFDETSLILINEELTPELMTQFSYECLGKDANFGFLSQLENIRTEFLVNKNKINTKIDNGDFFEGISEVKEAKDAKLKNKLISKYSSFLED
ncbi:MAG: hypothetical protein ACFFA6_08710, partial [Promethearchaeota archaeon]